METTQIDITEVINALVKDYFLMYKEFDFDQACDINDGCCGDFAADVASRVDGAKEIWGDELEEEFWDMGIEHWIEDHADAHCFIEYNGRYYDAEAPEGVDHPRDLPLYINHFAIAQL
jgi:hypothetical protein